MVIVFGTVALDTTRTPFKTVERVMGGAATYAGLSSSFFTKVNLVGVVGTDYPTEYLNVLKDRLDVSLLEKKVGKSFFFDSTFDHDLGKRFVNKTEENVIKDFKPVLPEKFRNVDYVYVGNNDPAQNIELLQQFENPKLTVCDTIKYWITNKRQDLIKMFGMIDVVIVNDEEARLISKNSNLIKCARNIMGWGPRFVIIKKGEHGAMLFKENCDFIFPAPGFPLENIVDPTGAGDSFAGGFIGHIERSRDFSERTLKEAIIYGNVMGSFAVEDFSIKRFLRLDLKRIEERFEKYRNLVYF